MTTHLKIMQQAFPDKKIIQIDVTEINFGGGGIHCLTQQQPSVKKVGPVCTEDFCLSGQRICP